MSVPVRSEIRSGLRVQIVEKQNQRTGALSEGIVARILTKSPTHPHGIKVMLDDGTVGRVQAIIDQVSGCSGQPESVSCGEKSIRWGFTGPDRRWRILRNQDGQQRWSST